MDLYGKKQIPEDVVQYNIFHKKVLSQESDATLDWNELLMECHAYIAKQTSAYIWQNESFNLCLSNHEKIPCLSGSTNFGDYVGDEWYIVYLLHQLTEKYPQLISMVYDNDGQFLLIETANVIPKWITPDNSLNRVFISQGVLHIVLKPKSPSEIPYIPVGNPTLQQSLYVVGNCPWMTQASSNILKCIIKRIGRYPKEAEDNIVTVNVLISRKIVHILDRHPSIIAACVSAFYLRDPIDLKACRQFKYFLPDDRVWTQIPMTKCHYAQLQQQQFIPDRRSGYCIKGNLNSNLKKGTDLGMKICHGFEILCSKSKPFSKDTNNGAIVDVIKLNNFIHALEEMGYFHGEIEGSKLHQRLQEKAKQYYNDFIVLNDKSGHYLEVVPKIINCLQELSECQHEPNLTKLEVFDPKNLPQDDSDDWLYLGNKELEDMVQDMNNGFENLQSKTSDIGPEEEKIQSSVKKVHHFVEKISDIEGVEMDDGVQFKSQDFLASLNSMLNMSKQNTNRSLESDGYSDDFLSSEDELSDDSPLSHNENDPTLQNYMDQMDEEIANTHVGKSFKSDITNPSDNIDKDLSEESKPPNIDFNLAQNFLQGMIQESSTSGPVTNILKSLGLDLKNIDLVN